MTSGSNRSECARLLEAVSYLPQRAFIALGRVAVTWQTLLVDGGQVAQ